MTPINMLGIFWLFKGQLILNTSPLSEGERFGDFLSHPQSHLDHWTEMQLRGEVPHGIKYEKPPRGRVAYNVKTKRFEFYADRCILKKDLVVKRIIAAMCLPVTLTDTSTGGAWGHYRCFWCLKASRAPLIHSIRNSQRESPGAL